MQEVKSAGKINCPGEFLIDFICRDIDWIWLMGKFFKKSRRSTSKCSSNIKAG
jgi:hypothetical protein